MASKGNNIPLAIDDEFLAEIDRVAELVKESRSAVMRMAIRAGLPIVERRHPKDYLSEGESELEQQLVAQSNTTEARVYRQVRHLTERVAHLEKLLSVSTATLAKKKSSK